ncbi:hypothetical protein [Arthrobacter cavernae]|uniref:Uncharacterized protein n=1 Tax=Arthrobacter cavernae TaxID=2817681 RepID=A0A939HAH3_9MICC|nr:hypothetical protein [Arthrobacter cavernae]MBO1267302.1 hypothetical protein [Arthrobacter cavernae]
MSWGEFVEKLSPEGHSALLTTSSLSVGFSGHSVQYAGTYQLWNRNAGSARPSHGAFHGRLEAGPQVWRWVEHHAIPGER